MREVRKRGGDLNILHMPETGRAWSSLNQEGNTPSGSPIEVKWPHSLGPSSVAFQEALAGSRMRNRIARC